MRLKKHLNWFHVHPQLWKKLEAMDLEHQVRVGEELVVTSLRRPEGRRISKHSPKNLLAVTAADVRRHRLDKSPESSFEAHKFAKWCQQELGLGVVLEPEWLTAEEIAERGGIEKVEPHIHVQLKLDAGDPGFAWSD